MEHLNLQALVLAVGVLLACYLYVRRVTHEAACHYCGGTDPLDPYLGTLYHGHDRSAHFLCLPISVRGDDAAIRSVLCTCPRASCEPGNGGEDE